MQTIWQAAWRQMARHLAPVFLGLLAATAVLAQDMPGARDIAPQFRHDGRQHHHRPFARPGDCHPHPAAQSAAPRHERPPP